jgi:hypothetical protein
MIQVIIRSQINITCLQFFVDDTKIFLENIMASKLAHTVSLLIPSADKGTVISHVTL